MQQGGQPHGSAAAQRHSLAGQMPLLWEKAGAERGCVPAWQDGGKAAQAKMEPSRQSVDAIKRVVAEARKKPGTSPAPAHGFNEEDVGGYMDGARPARLPALRSRLHSTSWHGADRHGLGPACSSEVMHHASARWTGGKQHGGG